MEYVSTAYKWSWLLGMLSICCWGESLDSLSKVVTHESFMVQVTIRRETFWDETTPTPTELA